MSTVFRINVRKIYSLSVGILTHLSDFVCRIVLGETLFYNLFEN